MIDETSYAIALEAKQKPITPCTRDLNELQVIAKNSNWSIALFAPFVIGRSNNSGIGFWTVISTAFLNLILGSRYIRNN